MIDHPLFLFPGFGYVFSLNPSFSLRADFLFPNRNNFLQAIDPVTSRFKNSGITVGGCTRDQYCRRHPLFRSPATTAVGILRSIGWTSAGTQRRCFVRTDYNSNQRSHAPAFWSIYRRRWHGGTSAWRNRQRYRYPFNVQLYHHQAAGAAAKRQPYHA